MTTPILDPLSNEPPKPLMDRPVYLQSGQMTTYRLMQDVPFVSNRFAAAKGGAQSSQNEVKYLVNAEEAFPEMLAAIRTAKDKTHFVYLLGWYLDLDVSLSGKAGGGDTLRTLLPPLAAAGVQCRAMLWRNSVMVSDYRPRWVVFYWVPALTLPRLEVQIAQPDPARPGFFLPAVPHPRLGELLVTHHFVPGDAAASIFDGSPDPWWARGLGTGPAITPHNTAECAFINALKSPEGDGHCAAILDHLVPIAGAHHQKLLIVYGTEGLIAFVGGMDINSDRYAPLYDTHTRVKGPSARDVLAIFNERWNSHPDRAGVEKSKVHLGNGVGAPSASDKDVSDVQVGRTYANGNRPRPSLLDLPTVTGDQQIAIIARNMDPFSGYAFAANGVSEVWEMYKAAISAAKQFIYIENQYFVSLELAALIKSAVAHVNHVTIVTQAASDLDGDRGYLRTKRCIDLLRSADPSGKKVRVLAIQQESRIIHKYVHSKMMIVDDDYAIVGTANASRRSFDCDSEAAVGIFDRIDGVARFRPVYRFAHRLRVRLWAELLDMNTPDGHAKLADPLGAIMHWEDARAAAAPPADALVWDYQKVYDAEKTRNPRDFNPPSSDEVWDFARDPFTPAPT